MVRESYTAVIARGEHWRGEAATEPYESAWANEAIFFLRALKVEGDLGGVRAKVQISADGFHWVDEGSSLTVPQTPGEVSFCRISHFGGYLRLASVLPEGAHVQVVASLNLKA